MSRRQGRSPRIGEGRCVDCFFGRARSLVASTIGLPRSQCHPEWPRCELAGRRGYRYLTSRSPRRPLRGPVASDAGTKSYPDARSAGGVRRDRQQAGSDGAPNDEVTRVTPTPSGPVTFTATPTRGKPRSSLSWSSTGAATSASIVSETVDDEKCRPGWSGDTDESPPQTSAVTIEIGTIQFAAYAYRRSGAGRMPARCERRSYRPSAARPARRNPPGARRRLRAPAPARRRAS